MAAGCAQDRLDGTSNLSVSLTLLADVTITSLSLTVYDGASCDTMGEVTGGSALAGLANLGIALGTPQTIQVSPGDRTFQVVAFDGADMVAHGCARTTLEAGGTAQVAITLHEIMVVRPDGGPDAMAADASPDATPIDAAPDATPPTPPGDTCGEVEPLVTGTTVGETLSAAYTNDFSGSCGGGGLDRVYTFSIIGTKHVVIQTQATFAHGLYLRAGDCAAGAEQSCQASSFVAMVHGATLDVPALMGGTYHVFVDGASAADVGAYDISLTVTSPPLPPTNDTCSTAAPIFAGFAIADTYDGTALDDTAAPCVGGAHGDVFFTFTLSAARYVTIVLTSGFDSSLTLQGGTCAAPTEIACANATTMGEQIIEENLPAGTYTLVVEPVAGGSGGFSLGYTEAPPIVRPDNDQCAGIITLTPGVVRTGDNVHNGLDDADGSCGDTTSGDVVYQFTIPPGMNQRAQINVTNANGFDPVVYARAGSCAGVELGCAQVPPASELLDLPDLSPGTYFVWVDALGGETAPATFDIRVDLLPAVTPPTNDTCAAPTALVAGVAQAGSTLGATDDYGLICLPSDSRDAVWQLATAGAQAVLVTVDPVVPGWNAALALRPAASCGTAGSEVSCVANGFTTRYLNQKNLSGSYDVIVDGVGGASGDYTIRFDTRPADSTYGYWAIDTTGTYAGLTGATALPIPLSTPADMDTGAGDEWSQGIPLPFTFEFYGVDYTAVNAYSNMFLNFGTVVSGEESWTNDCTGAAATAPNNVIAPFWDDGVSRSEYPSELLTKTEGTAPNRRFIIEWKNFDQLSCGGMGCFRLTTSVNQQAILYESTNDIELRYGPRTAPSVSTNCNGGGSGGQQHLGACATIGLEGQVMGTPDSDQIQCDTVAPNVVDGRVVYFVAPR